MKKIFLLMMLVPALAYTQSKPKTTKKATPVKTVAKTNTVALKVAPDEFVIQGSTQGMIDGVVVTLHNTNTGEVVQKGVVANNKFILKGKITEPNLQAIMFNNLPPYVIFMLEPGVVTKVNVNNAEIDKAKFEAGKEQDAFNAYNNTFNKYDKMLSGGESVTYAQIDEAAADIEKFIFSHSDYSIAPIAIMKYNQIMADPIKVKEMAGKLPEKVKATNYGKMLMNSIAESSAFAIGSVLPEFSQADTAGNIVSSSSLKGKYVLIDFWASWCRPCRMENPNVVAAFNKYKQFNFDVLGVSLDNKKEPWLEAIKADKLQWTQLSDLKGWANEVSQKFGISSIPQNVLIDPSGKVVGANLRGFILDYRLYRLLVKK